ncbi:methyltransferase [Ginsengibacter hankyongi]|uniref:tRNA1(Val) (adenine(37)-N6)-methyltransferase n=1 Tax=Ginsengibacter hankyongi TaxID=2607284 RepID=A0A5J5IFP0_9BACT|nr:methyltransferase [Ginsengibacter hankyongi]KAA9038444.1 methyltransferase [Ginsengibacter hankyongi]
MSNQYFQFKKFKVQQDKSSMKVCTDSCLFGAWIAAALEQKNISAETILDIGTGTGLLSMMLGQKSDACIDAVEIDINAFEQAKDNVGASPWHERIKLFHSNIKNFDPGLKYDLVISNPPFYENDLTAQDEGRNISKHSIALSLEELIIISKNLLSKDGTLAVLLPWHRTKLFEDVASKYSFFIKGKMQVKQTTSHNYFRTMLILTKTKSETIETELTIKNSENNYSDEFKSLLKDYYLYL